MKSEAEWQNLLQTDWANTNFNIDSFEFDASGRANAGRNSWVHIRLVTSKGDIFYYVSNFTVYGLATNPT